MFKRSPNITRYSQSNVEERQLHWDETHETLSFELDYGDELPESHEMTLFLPVSKLHWI